MCTLLLTTTNGFITAQEINGIILDKNNDPIEYVTVVLQTIDSVFIDATISNEQGRFNIPMEENKDCILLFQHLIYNHYQLTLDKQTRDVGVITLQEKDNLLDDIVIKAERPILKIEGSTLSYNPERIIEESVVSNAYDVLKKIPGVVEMDNNIQLVGAGSVAIVLNGQVSTVDSEQLLSILKSMPASQVKNIDIMYNAPAKYNIRGALINIITNKTVTKERKVIGEVTGRYSQSHYASERLSSNISYRQENLNMDVMVNISKNKNLSRSETYSVHSIENLNTVIDQKTQTISDADKLAFRLSGDYTFKNTDQLNWSYFYDGQNSDSDNTSDNIYDTELIKSRNQGEGNQHLHNIHIEYLADYGLRVGGDYTFFKDKNNNRYKDYLHDSSVRQDFLNNSSQDINRWQFFANYDHRLNEKWEISTGVNIGLNNSDTYVDYLFNQGNRYVEDLDMRLDNTQDEFVSSYFIESSNKINDRFSFDISLQVQYFKSDYIQNNIKSNLWEEWALFPSFSMSYSFANSNMLQFSFSSDKKYPSYWAINPQTTHVNSYMEITGNPLLKPGKVYDGNLMYIINRKYILMGFVTHRPKYFTQMPYQDKDELKIIYKYENFDYDLKLGIGGVVPFKVKSFWNADITVYGMKVQQKIENFHDHLIKRDKYVLAAFWDNTFILSKNVSAQLNAVYQSKSIQGTYDLGNMYDLTFGLKWSILDDLYVLCEYKNILKHGYPNPTVIDWGNQYSKRKNIEYSYVNLVLSWKFGNYKAKRVKAVDTSRFQR
ncbi:MAG: TonB-dependent receptor [Tannerellaceae bacterium]|nr:TonB-dependent receptor [Tannerellaceae bacterium]